MCYLSPFINSGYLAQSNGGTFDVESLAVLILVVMCFFYTKAIKTGSIVFSTLAALAYGLLTISWARFAIVGNMVALYMILIILSNRFSIRTYVAYSTFYAMTALLGLKKSVFKGFESAETLNWFLCYK